jgi:hypothetical protein
MAKKTAAPTAAHKLLRHVPWTKLRKDAEDNILGVLATAFRLRDGETYLSATWVEHFGDLSPANVHAAVHAIRAARSVGAKSGFSAGIVGDIVNACATVQSAIRIVCEPDGINTGHTAVRRWPKDNQDLFEVMATDKWAELFLNSSIP